MCDGDDCCKRLCKFLLVVINLFFLLLGLLMLAFGIAMVAAPDQVAKSVKETGADLAILGNANYIIKAAGIFMIVLGGIVAIIGAFGFFGACCENKVLLILYLIIIVIILLAEVALIIFAACYPANLKAWIQEEMNKTLINDFKEDVAIYPNFTFGSTKTLGYSWAATQFGAKCCGAYGPENYNNDSYKGYNNEQRLVWVGANENYTARVPISCCTLKEGLKFPDGIKGIDSFVDLRGCLQYKTAFNEKDCYTSINDMIMQASRIAIGIAAAIVGFQIIIIVVGLCLFCQLRKYQKSAAI